MWHAPFGRVEDTAQLNWPTRTLYHATAARSVRSRSLSESPLVGEGLLIHLGADNVCRRTHFSPNHRHFRVRWFVFFDIMEM